MQSLVAGWAEPPTRAGQIELQTRVTRIERDALQPAQWQLRTESLDGAVHVYSGFDGVLLAAPAAQAQGVLRDFTAAPWVKRLDAVQTPC